MSLRNELERRAGKGSVAGVMNALKDLTADPVYGYLHLPLIAKMRDGTDDAAIERWFLGPFAESRPWLPEMEAIFISRFYDHPFAYVVARNLAEEFGAEVGAQAQKLSHSAQYRRILDECRVEVVDGMMSIPVRQYSAEAKAYGDWFASKVKKESIPYLLGFFWAYEIEGDAVDFPFYLMAAERIWSGREDLLHFFRIHAATDHDTVFGEDLQPMLDAHFDELLNGMSDLHKRWTEFHRLSASEVGL